MELKTQDGFTLVKTEDLHKIKKMCEFIQESKIKDSISKTWRLLNKLELMLGELRDS
jgi:hypothetical protein